MQYNRLYATEHKQIYDHGPKLSIKPALRETPNLSISIKQPTFLSSPYIFPPDSWPHAYYYEPITPDSANCLTLPGPSPASSSSPYSADSRFFIDDRPLYPDSDAIPIYSYNNGSAFEKLPIAASNGCLLDDHPNHPDTMSMSNQRRAFRAQLIDDLFFPRRIKHFDGRYYYATIRQVGLPSSQSRS